MTKTEIAILDNSLKAISNYLKHAKAARDTVVRYDPLVGMGVVTHESLAFAIRELRESASQLSGCARDFLSQTDLLAAFTVAPTAGDIPNGPAADVEEGA
jgi:hypothetical protein